MNRDYLEEMSRRQKEMMKQIQRNTLNLGVSSVVLSKTPDTDRKEIELRKEIDVEYDAGDMNARQAMARLNEVEKWARLNNEPNWDSAVERLKVKFRPLAEDERLADE